MTRWVALIGLGAVAWRGWPGTSLETHMTGIESCPNTWLSVACDVSEKARADFSEHFAGVPVVRDPKVAAMQADIVTICTPPDTHADVLEDILPVDGVRAVICEKPLAPTVKEAARMVSMCKEAGKVLIVVHQRRYETAHRALQRFVDGGSIGRVMVAKAWFPGDYMNNGVHAADLCRFIVGDNVPWSIERRLNSFGISVAGENGHVSLESYGHLKPGYMAAIYQDAVGCMMDNGRTPACSGEDGVNAVRHAIYAEEAGCIQATA